MLTAPASALSGPPNDDFANASPVVGAQGSVLGTNVGADREIGELDHGNLGGGSIWYRWRAPADGLVGFVAQGGGVTLLAVYTGGSVDALTSVAANSGNPAAVAFRASKDAVYRIAVDGFDGLLGSFILGWAPVPSAELEEEEEEEEEEVLGTRPRPDLLAFDELRVGVTDASLFTGLRVGNGRKPFAGDRRLLTTVSPNGDGLRDAAVVRFRLARAASVTVEAFATRVRLDERVWVARDHFGPGLHQMVWKPGATIEPRAYLLRVVAVDRFGNRAVFGKRSPHAAWPPQGPVVRVRGLDAGFRRRSYRPHALAKLRVATDVRRFTLQFFRAGPDPQPEYAHDKMKGAPVSDPIEVDWAGRRGRPGTLWVRLGGWESGVYFARLSSADGRVGFAPVIMRPARFGLHRVAVVLPTNTWQAYNFQDVNGDGWGDTWYASLATRTVDLARVYYRGGAPGPWLYDRGFIRWLSRTGKHPDFFAEDDIQRLRSGNQLAAAYDLVVYSGHAEYVTAHEYDVIERYRDLGGNLMFLAANDFFRRVDRRRQRLTLVGLWRDLGRPEAPLLGVQYIGYQPFTYGKYVVTGARTVPWVMLIRLSPSGAGS